MKPVPWRYLIQGSALDINEISLSHFQQNFFQPGLPVVLRNPLPTSLAGNARSLAPYYEALRPTDGLSKHSGLRLWKQSNILTKGEDEYSCHQPLWQCWDTAFGGNHHTSCPFEIGVSPRQQPGLTHFLLWLRARLPDIPRDDIVDHQLGEQDMQLESLLSTELRSCTPGSSMIRFEGPISLFKLAVMYNHASLSSGGQPLANFYVAQLPIADLPPNLQAALAPPHVVLNAGKGDVYGGSLWMGLTPTKTSWHRDPNPNILSQSVGSKLVRMMPPRSGERVFHDVHSRLGTRNFNSRFRGMELLDGPEATALDDAVWGPDADQMPEMVEVTLNPDESLFIPKGWWHSVKSLNPGTAFNGLLNVSVNYWFR
ncbi:hypothetical protein MCOR07_003284 [Pyricularia oryzae]|uniref:JmjC domain-containing protein n=2 Tax=Pyricularia TaxID=48558 RepID=A0ABQ8P2Y9_PYRGI|nr:hypothetical protein MCOR01_007666 [Pyricularia oryzae]KAI6304540.1 hypothetical protein MCOR33_000397 [Pyricularia grisea]KAI6262539.1 hypothetical protein MCOR19_001240 [Pyricularia oryzae]KAI6315946.1 hypothetical protein MCOR34_004479 [Pyricularia oryzae]KAI6344826.1 hypothetical protein MCOR30_001085 [Pyricularia oryzae]